MKHIILACSLMLVVTATYPSFAQYDDTDAGGEETPAQDSNQSPNGGGGEPVIVPQQPYEYYYWPEENLDNFGLSTLGQGEGGSTLGRSLNRKSNIEVNTPKKPAEDEDTENGEPGGEDTDTELYPPDESGLTDGSLSGEQPPPAPKESEFYEWVDENGNVHITNNLGDVPPDQQEEAYKRKSAPGGE
ncbi:MAG TPA: DUF4124 domain-containing protein [Thermodesulfobacteriota bacterium]|nr:DUF4124 domain-containing protein [Thermodesulfobacteriota bacterium]